MCYLFAPLTAFGDDSVGQHDDRVGHERCTSHPGLVGLSHIAHSALDIPLTHNISVAGDPRAAILRRMLIRLYVGNKRWMIGVKPWQWEIMTELTRDLPHRAMLGLEFSWGSW
jgi:hypothetical protein